MRPQRPRDQFADVAAACALFAKRLAQGATPPVHEVRGAQSDDHLRVALEATGVGIWERGFVADELWWSDGTVLDITRQQQAEAALCTSEARLRTIVATAPDCVMLLDRDGLALEMNPAGLAMLEAEP